MGDDVIELVEVLEGGVIRQVPNPELDIPKLGVPGQRPAAFDRRFRRIEPDDPRAGEGLRDRERVTAIAASKLEHPAAGGGCRLEVQQATYCVKSRRVGRGIGVPRVGEFLVCLGRGGRDARGAQNVVFFTRFQPELVVLVAPSPWVLTTPNWIFWYSPSIASLVSSPLPES